MEKKRLVIIDRFMIGDVAYVTFLAKGNAHVMTWEEYQSWYARYYKQCYDVVNVA